MRWPFVMLVTAAMACGGADASNATPPAEPRAADALVIPPMDAGAAPLAIAAEPTTPEPAPPEPPPVPADDLATVRDPRAKTPPRSAKLVATELKGLETLLATTTAGTPSRAQLLRRLTDGYADYRGLAYEQVNQRAKVRAAYYDLIRSRPASKLVPCAYFAFGEMFRDEARADPSKLELAKQAFKEAAKYPAPANTCFVAARDRLSSTP